MPAPRFFVAMNLAAVERGDVVALPEAVAHHAIRVVRLAAGDALTLFDGTGGECAATIAAVGKRGATARIDRRDPVERESPLEITLAQAIAANDAMDIAVRKATELGVAAIQPLVTARSAPLPAGARSDRRREHWRQVAIAACEQCGRNRLPDVREPRPLGPWLAQWKGEGVVLDPAAPRGFVALDAPRGAVAVLVGPEGGLAPEEIEQARRAGFAAVRFGPRILRTETAALAALAVMQLLWGDLR